MKEYKKIILKLSGESLATDRKRMEILEYLTELATTSEENNEIDTKQFKDALCVLSSYKDFGINYDYVLELCKKINHLRENGIQIGIVVGGGNFWRGRSNKQMNKVTSDHIGMLGTAMNALAVEAGLKEVNTDDRSIVRVQTAIEMKKIAEPYSHKRAEKHFENDRIVIFGCGTGNPGYSTDTAAAQMAMEIEADAIVKITNVDGVYDKDPNTYDDAKLFKTIKYDDVLKYKAMDATAYSLSMDNDIPIIVMNIKHFDDLLGLLQGKELEHTTLISNEVETNFY